MILARVPRALAAFLLGAVAGAALAVFAYVVRPQVDMTMDTDLPAGIRGMHPAERNASGETYAWTMDRADFNLAGLSRSVPWLVTVRLRGGRQNPADLPEVQLSADGVVIAAMRAANEFQDLQGTIPARADANGVRLRLTSSTTFVPGPEDPRRLGVVIDRLTIAPAARTVVIPPGQTIRGAATAAALMGGAFGLIGVTAGSAVAGAIVLALAQGFVFTRDLAPFTPYARAMPWIAFWIAAVATISVWIVEAIRREPLRNTARFAVVFSAAVLFLQLLVLLHPEKHIGDAMFHAHRFQLVRSGTYYFTSIAPGGYQFPYPTALYVFADQFSSLTRDQVWLLRIIVACVNAVAAVLLYVMIVRTWGDRLAGAIAVALFHLIPIAFAVQGAANLTNSFGQSLSVAAMTCVVAAAMRMSKAHAAWILPAAGFAFAAFLSHTSTFVLLAAIMFFTGVLYVVAGGTPLRSAGYATLAALAISVALATGVYYAHFPEVYRSQFSRISREVSGEEGEMGARPNYTQRVEPHQTAYEPGGRNIGVRAAAVPRYVGEYFGWAVVVLAAAGAVQLVRMRARDRLGLALAGWILACAAFLVLGVVTPIDMRYYLAAFPALAMLGGAGAAWMWRAAIWTRAVAAALLGWIVFMGTHGWIRWI